MTDSKTDAARSDAPVTCGRCGAVVHSPCDSDFRAADCELPDSCFPNGRKARPRSDAESGEYLAWLDQEISGASDKQKRSYAIATESGQRLGERYHSRQCALWEAKQKFQASNAPDRTDGSMLRAGSGDGQNPAAVGCKSATATNSQWTWGDRISDLPDILERAKMLTTRDSMVRQIDAALALVRGSEAGEPFQHRQFLARARPKDRGPIPCMYPGCEATFKNEWACTQHRIAVHNEGAPVPSAQRCTGADDLEHLDGMFDDRERGS